MKLSKRDKKFITAGAVAVAIFCVFKFGLFPLYDTFLERRSEIEQKENTKEKYLKFLKEQADFQKKMKEKGFEEGFVQQSLLKGETPSLAAADIQKTAAFPAYLQRFQFRLEARPVVGAIPPFRQGIPIAAV